MALKSWWSLDGVLTDSTFNNNNLTNSNATVSNSGKIGKSYQFSNSYLIGNNPISNSSFSITAWHYITSSSSTQTIFCSRTILGGGVTIFIAEGKYRLDSSGDQWSTGIVATPNKWVHISFISDANNKKLYINGELVASKAIKTTHSNLYTKCYIGASLVNDINPTNFFIGRLNDIRVYNHPLSDKEIYDISLGNIVNLDMKYDKTSQDKVFNSNKIYDISGFDNNTSLDTTSAPMWNIESRVGLGSYYFDGTKRLVIPKIFFDNTNQEWTVVAWIKISSLTSNPTYLDNMNLGNLLTYDTNKKVKLSINDGANLTDAIGTSLPIDTWIHIAYVYSSYEQICKIYVNGELNATSTNISSSKTPKGFQDTHIIGENFDGYLNEYKIYATALSEEKIKDAYNAVIEIDNVGNIYGKALNEIDVTNGFTKEGVININNLYECFCGETYLMGDDDIVYVTLSQWNASNKYTEIKSETPFTCNGINITQTFANVDFNKLKNKVVLTTNQDSIFCNEINEK